MVTMEMMDDGMNQGIQLQQTQAASTVRRQIDKDTIISTVFKITEDDDDDDDINNDQFLDIRKKNDQVQQHSSAVDEVPLDPWWDDVSETPTKVNNISEFKLGLLPPVIF